jgi:soluble lytic murein transglycosylase-like protein
MKFIIFSAAVLVATSALADDMSSAEFFARDRANNWTKPLVAESYVPSRPQRTARTNARQEQVVAVVARQAEQKLGRKWVKTAVKIAHVESRFNPSAVGPKTRHGRAQGVMQVMPGTARAMGYDPRRLRETEYGVAAGVEHMRLCLLSGVQTEAQMAKCFVAGLRGWKVKLRPWAERYKWQYVAMVNVTPRHRE